MEASSYCGLTSHIAVEAPAETKPASSGYSSSSGLQRLGPGQSTALTCMLSHKTVTWSQSISIAEHSSVLPVTAWLILHSTLCVYCSIATGFAVPPLSPERVCMFCTSTTTPGQFRQCSCSPILCFCHCCSAVQLRHRAWVAGLHLRIRLRSVSVRMMVLRFAHTYETLYVPA